jgi:hypothetical protein
VPAGATSTTFILNTKSVSSSLTSLVFVSDTVTGQSAYLTVTP